MNNFKHILLTFALASSGIIAAANVLNFIDQHWLSSTVVQAATPPAAPAPSRPKMRVGLFSSDDPVVVSVSDTSTVAQHTVTANTPITLQYNRTTQLYTATTTDWSTTTTQPVRVKPSRRNQVVTITSYSNPPAWNASLNDNQFYGAIELHYAPATDKVWVVNQLGIENYVQGVSESSNSAPTEFLKTLYTAARTYAYYNYLHPTKHANEPYIVDTTANDQVYRGYGFDQRSPNVVAAVKATAGQVIQYNGETIVTPYFSQSDGRTRSWREVWGGDTHPYLQSVSDPGCTGDALLGHGVGLSASGALYFDTEEGWTSDQILKYYYQGVSINQLW